MPASAHLLQRCLVLMPHTRHVSSHSELMSRCARELGGDDDEACALGLMRRFGEEGGRGAGRRSSWGARWGYTRETGEAQRRLEGERSRRSEVERRGGALLLLAQILDPPHRFASLLFRSRHRVILLHACRHRRPAVRGLRRPHDVEVRRLRVGRHLALLLQQGPPEARASPPTILSTRPELTLEPPLLERSELDIAEKRLDEVALPFQPGAKSLRKKLLGFGPVASAEVRRAGCPTGSERACVLTLSPLALAERAR